MNRHLNSMTIKCFIIRLFTEKLYGVCEEAQRILFSRLSRNVSLGTWGSDYMGCFAASDYLSIELQRKIFRYYSQFHEDLANNPSLDRDLQIKLAKLGDGKIINYLLSNRGGSIDFEEIFSIFIDLLKNGKVKNIGELS